MTLAKTDIIQNVGNLGYAKQDLGKIVGALLEVIKSRLEGGEGVLVGGFGKLYVMDSLPRRVIK